MFFTSGRADSCTPDMWLSWSGFLQANESDAAIHHHLRHIHIHWGLINTLLGRNTEKLLGQKQASAQAWCLL